MAPKKRVIHTYLSCFFAPMLLFFVVTGAMQVLKLHDEQKSYSPPKAVYALTQVHMQQRWKVPGQSAQTSKALQWFVLAMSAGFVAMVTLGVLIALENRQRKLNAIFCLAAGAIVPVVLLLLSPR